MSTDLTPEQKEIVERSHSSMRDWTTREERREIYMMVAKDMLSKTRPGEGFFINELNLKADVIYQGLVKFCGEAR